MNIRSHYDVRCRHCGHPTTAANFASIDNIYYVQDCPACWETTMYRLDNPPDKTSFEEFMTSKSYTKNLRITLPDQFEDCDGRPGPIKGYVYLGHYYIMWDVDLMWYLVLGNQEYNSVFLHDLEKILYESEVAEED